MEKNRIIEEILSALTLNSFQEDSYELMYEYQGND